jgi:hypothetical protein
VCVEWRERGAAEGRRHNIINESKEGKKKEINSDI